MVVKQTVWSRLDQEEEKILKEYKRERVVDGATGGQSTFLQYSSISSRRDEKNY